MAKRESYFIRMARIALETAEAVLPRYSHPKSPHRYTLPQLASCVLLMFRLKLSYRDMEEWLLATDGVCQALQLKRVPDHATLYRAYQRLRLKTLKQMNQAFLGKLGAEEELIAADATGYRTTAASAYYQARCGRTYREWSKGAYAVGTQSQLILAWRQGRGPGNDAPFLNGLRRDAGRYGRHGHGQRQWMMISDAGFDGRGVQEGDLIPPIRRHANLVSPERKARAELVSAARLDGIYGQRWKSETVHSVIKRKLGDAVRSRKVSHRRREPAVKGLVYNLHVR
jgi:hypothetical protein